MKPIPTWREALLNVDPQHPNIAALKHNAIANEIDALRTRLAEFDKLAIFLKAECEAQHARCAEVEKDAARYRHIRDSKDWMVIKGMRQSPYFMGAPLDRNIDADIAKEQA